MEIVMSICFLLFDKQFTFFSLRLWRSSDQLILISMGTVSSVPSVYKEEQFAYISSYQSSKRNTIIVHSCMMLKTLTWSSQLCNHDKILTILSLLIVGTYVWNTSQFFQTILAKFPSSSNKAIYEANCNRKHHLSYYCMKARPLVQ